MKIKKLKNILTNLLTFKSVKHRKYWYNNVEGNFILLYKFKTIENKINKLIKKENKIKHIDNFQTIKRENTILLSFLIGGNWTSNNTINIGASLDYLNKLSICPDKLLSSIIDIINNKIGKRKLYFSERINSFSLDYNILENAFILNITLDLYHKNGIFESDKLIKIGNYELIGNIWDILLDYPIKRQIEISESTFI